MWALSRQSVIASGYISSKIMRCGITLDLCTFVFFLCLSKRKTGLFLKIDHACLLSDPYLDPAFSSWSPYSLVICLFNDAVSSSEKKSNNMMINELRFQVLTATCLKIAVFCDVAPCSLIVDRRFRGAVAPDEEGSTHLYLYGSTRRCIPEGCHPNEELSVDEFLSQTVSRNVTTTVVVLRVLSCFLLGCALLHEEQKTISVRNNVSRMNALSHVREHCWVAF
jgi:hypothetical protein